jgi:nucleotide-binding universal stress UspA family protein
MYEHLLVALDGSPAAEHVLTHAEALATAFSSEVVLLRSTVSAEVILAETAVSENTGDMAPMIDPMPIVEAEKESASSYLEAVARRLQERQVKVTIEEPEGQPADVIVKRARELGTSLIVMSTHARGGLGRFVFGSVADNVLRHAPCPVLLVRIVDQEPNAKAKDPATRV